MTTVPATTPPAPPHAAPERNEVTVVSHSNIFYWWPVWAVGFIMGFWTLAIDRHLMVVVPADAKTFAHASVAVEDAGVKFDDREVVVLEKGKKLSRRYPDDKEPAQPRAE